MLQFVERKERSPQLRSDLEQRLSDLPMASGYQEVELGQLPPEQHSMRGVLPINGAAATSSQAQALYGGLFDQHRARAKSLGALADETDERFARTQSPIPQLQTNPELPKRPDSR